MTACIPFLHSFVSEQLNAQLSAILHPPGLEELSSVWFSFPWARQGFIVQDLIQMLKSNVWYVINDQTVQARSFPVSRNLFPENLFVQLFTYLSLYFILNNENQMSHSPFFFLLCFSLLTLHMLQCLHCEKEKFQAGRVGRREKVFLLLCVGMETRYEKQDVRDCASISFWR